MSTTLEDFAGTFTIRHGDGELGLVQKGNLLCIGTGKHDDPPSDGIKIGVTVFDPESGRQVIPAEGHPPNYAYLVDGTLNGSSYWLGGEQLPQPLSYQISLMKTIRTDGTLFKAPTVKITIGDPESVGVWGADDDTGGG